MNVRAVTKISAILMVVFIGIETFLSFLRLVDAGNNMSGFGYKFLFGSTPWLMLTAILAVWVIGLNVVQHGPQWFKMAAFVAMVAAAGLRVLAWLIYCSPAIPDITATVTRTVPPPRLRGLASSRCSACLLR